MNKRIKALVFILLMILPFILSAQLLPIRYDHNDKVSAICANAAQNILVSGCADGSIIIRTLSDYTIQARLQTGSIPIQGIAINPSFPIIAISQSDNFDTFLLTVWNYETGKKQIQYRLKDKPLFVNYSPKGSYLYYGTTRSNSLTLLSNQTGHRMPWLTEMDSIITSFLISDDERKAVMYSPSGIIRIYNIRTGAILKKSDCLPDLVNPIFIAKGALLFGSIRDKLVAISSKSGNIKNSTLLHGVVNAVANNKPGHIALYTFQNGYANIYDWNLVKKNQGVKNIAPSRDFSDVSSMCYHSDFIFCGNLDGEIFQFNQKGKRKLISNLNIAAWSGIALSQKVLALINEKELQLIPIQSLEKSKSMSELFKVTRIISNPLLQKSAICQIDESHYLIYNTEGKSGKIFLLNTVNGKSQLKASTQAPLIKVKKIKQGYICLDKSGNSFRLSKDQYQKEFTYSSFGTRTIAPISSEKMISGQAKDSIFNSSLVLVDSSTGETVPMKTPELITFDICYNEELLSLYTIGIEKRANRMRTVLKIYRGKQFQRVETLCAVNGEHHDSLILYDPYTSKIYTTLGSKGIRIVQWGGFTTSQYSGHIPSDLVVNQKYLIALNKDGSVSAWIKNKGKLKFSLFKFPNDSWLKINPGKEVESQPEWEDYIF